MREEIVRNVGPVSEYFSSGNITELVNRKLDEDYFALFAVDLNAGLVQVLKKPPRYDSGEPGTIMPHETAMKKFASVFDGETKEFFERISSTEHLKERFKDDDKASYVYPSHIGGEKEWVSMTAHVLKRNSDSTPFLLAFFFSFLDKDAAEKEEMVRLQKIASDAKRLVDNITSENNLVYIVNMETDELVIRRMDSEMMESGQHFKTFTEAKNFALTRVIHPRDRKRIEKELEFDTIRKRLQRKLSYSVEYSVIKHGATYLGEMKITSVDKDRVIIGIAENDLALTKKHLEDKRYNEYFALFVTDLDTERLKVVKNSVWQNKADVGDSVPYAPLILSIAKDLEGEGREFFLKLADLNYIRRELSSENKRTFTFKYENMGSCKWVDVTTYAILRHEDDTPSVFTLAFSFVDSLSMGRHELQRKLKEDMHMIGGLADRYLTLYYIDIEERVFKIYSLDGERFPEAKQSAIEDVDPFEMLRNYGASKVIHPDDRDVFASLDADYLREKLKGCKKYTLRFRRLFGDEYRWCEMDVIKYDDIDEEAKALVIGFEERDEAIRKEIEYQEQLKEALERADAANRSKTGFLFNMSHDIRTPMNAIKGFTAMAKKYADDKEKVTAYLDKIDISGQQLLTLINQVLEMARIESGKIEFEEKPVNVQKEFDSMVTVLSEQAKVNGLTFHYSLEDIKHFDIMADVARMSSITLNIAGNAMKYTPKGGKVDFSLREIQPRFKGRATYVYSVEDTGIGMSEDFLKVLFEPFSREKSSTVSKIQGTGLGMSIVKNLVDLLGGSIEVHSELGKGTRFDITIDFRLNEEAEAAKEAENSVPSVSFEGKRVLLVEDNEMNREIATDIFEEQGLIVEDADDGDVAVEMVRSAFDKGNYRYYDFILMDVQMPTMDGYEATRQIRALPVPEGIHVPIIAMTANAFEEDRQNAINSGMDEHVPKPIDITRLKRTLAKFL